MPTFSPDLHTKVYHVVGSSVRGTYLTPKDFSRFTLPFSSLSITQMYWEYESPTGMKSLIRYHVSPYVLEGLEPKKCKYTYLPGDFSWSNNVG